MNIEQAAARCDTFYRLTRARECKEWRSTVSCCDNIMKEKKHLPPYLTVSDSERFSSVGRHCSKYFWMIFI